MDMLFLAYLFLQVIRSMAWQSRYRWANTHRRIYFLYGNVHFAQLNQVYICDTGSNRLRNYYLFFHNSSMSAHKMVGSDSVFYLTLKISFKFLSHVHHWRNDAFKRVSENYEMNHADYNFHYIDSIVGMRGKCSMYVI